ncbi:TRAP transporter small permease subunit [Motiliproteus sp. SC1-56]|uniref:TRAP transporter small permease subunit n=1 Tax=Motiliproteus sp. SC1-56 TaxID=2799565 RepID=UPI001A8CDD27|nr:TRAP transporter small permease subunit [Motiliproteus sp. SC1-56]
MTMSDREASGEGYTHLPDADEFLHHHTELPNTRFSLSLDALITAIGKVASWLWLVVTGVIIWAVVGRYIFGQGSVTLEELQWHLAGAGWLLGLAYTLAVDDHVRVDVIHERLSLKTQGWIEFFGIVLLLLPFLAIAVYEMIPYALSSYEVGESSPAPAGLSNRWVLKAVLALSFILLAVAALSRLLRVTALLFGFPKPIIRPNNDKDEGDAS